ncbi:MAG: DUF3857 and transglutaminase domain-containing protein [Bacteroidales bacterium]|jgi:hypothetical protein|nr:DUF3857 and transglutaminase domain-containing protein [Bacteroidales bacterium]
MLKKLSFSLILVFVCASLFAGPKDIIKKAGDTKKYPGADYLVVYDRTEVDVKESGLSYNNIHRLYKVLTEQGAKKLNTLTFDYDPLSAFIKVKEVKIYRVNGEVDILDMSMVQDFPAPARMIYWGARKKMVDIGKLIPGDAIEVKMFKKGFTYALLQQDVGDDSRYIPPMRGHFYDIVEFWNSQPVLEIIYEVKVPNSKYFKYKFFNGDVKVNKKNLGEKTLYTFTKTDMFPINHERGMVGISNVASKLLMTTSPDWETKSRWFHGVNEDFGSFDSTPEIDKKVNEILEGATNEMDSISRLNHWVADNIRYSGLSMGEGEGYTLHKSEMTFSDRCGVCKDKAGMAITMLRSAGFESYPAMTMAGSRIEDIPVDQFNHCVTLVKLHSGEYKLLDPTWVPFVREEWSSREQQQNYLPGIPGGDDLKITPISKPENHPLTIKGTSTILENGTLQGTIIVDADGQSDASIRGIFTRNRKDQWEKALKTELVKIAQDIQITEINYNNPYGYMEAPIHLEIKYSIMNYATITENEIIFTPLVASNLFKRAQAHLYAKTSIDKRKFSFRDGCSRLVNLSETIVLPSFKDAIYLPESNKLDGTAASFDGKYSIKDNQLVLRETITIKKRIFEAEEWNNYKSVIEAQQKYAKEKIILSR